MATASVSNSFVNGTPADATQVNANFTSLVNFLNNSVVHRDGSKSMTGNFDAGTNKIVNVTAGTASGDAVNKGQLDLVEAAAVPVGSIVMWGSATAPSQWLLCNGDPVSRSTYAALFAVIGTTFGSGDGSTTFNVPNFRDRFPAGVSADSDSFADALGETGGDQNAVVVFHTHTHELSMVHTHTTPAHTHTSTLEHYTVTDRTLGGGGAATVAYGQETGGGWSTTGIRQSASSGGGTSGGPSPTTLGGQIDETGVSGINKNLPPYLAINFIIKAGV